MHKFEPLQKDESRAQSADSLKAYRKPRAFNCLSKISNLLIKSTSFLSTSMFCQVT